MKNKFNLSDLHAQLIKVWEIDNEGDLSSELTKHILDWHGCDGEFYQAKVSELYNCMAAPSIHKLNRLVVGHREWEQESNDGDVDSEYDELAQSRHLDDNLER